MLKRQTKKLTRPQLIFFAALFGAGIVMISLFVKEKAGLRQFLSVVKQEPVINSSNNKPTSISQNKDIFIKTNADQNGTGYPDYPGTLFDKLVSIGANGRTLRMVSSSDFYVRDDSFVYWCFPNMPIRKIEGADPETFTLLKHPFFNNQTLARDHNHVYDAGVISEGVDPSLLSAVGDTKYYSDTHAVYYEFETNSNDYQFALKKITAANPHSIREVPGLSRYDPMGGEIVIDDANLYIGENTFSIFDIKTLEYHGNAYFSDSKGVYFLSSFGTSPVIEKVGTTSVFRALTTGFGDQYSVIGQQVFIGTSSIFAADPASFIILGANATDGAALVTPCVQAERCPFSKDKNHVYYYGKQIFGADPSSFTLIGYGLLRNMGKDPSPAQPLYARDVHHVYYKDKIIQGADPKTFSPVVSGGYYFQYGHDYLRVFYEEKQIVGADLDTFRVLEGQQPYEGCAAGHYSVDVHHVYFEEKLIEGGDPTTFKVIVGGGSYGEDKKFFYVDAISGDRKKFQPCNFG